MALAVVLVNAGCSGDDPACDSSLETAVCGWLVGEDDRALDSGLVLVQSGPAHQGSFLGGTAVGDDGRFVAALSGGGTWALHVFHDDALALTLEITVAENEQAVVTNDLVVWDRCGEATGLPPPEQPDDSTTIRVPPDDDSSDDPLIEDVTMSYEDAGELLELAVDARDPDGDLSWVLAFDPVTGDLFGLNPPGPPDDQGNFPDGEYSLNLLMSPNYEPGNTVLQLVAVDRACNAAAIIEATLPPST